MSNSEGSGQPLQAYNSAASDSRSQVNARPKRSTPMFLLGNGQGSAEAHNDVEFILLRVVGKDRIPILQSSEIELDTSNWLGDLTTRSGFSMQVYKGQLKATGQSVALKRFKTYFYDKEDKDGLRIYRQSMLDFYFELQILSKPSLRHHRNIVTLLGIVFSDESSPGQYISIPISIVELAHPQYPDLSLFFDRKNNPGLPNQIPFNISASLIADIADGVAALHKHDIVHADLKPANILLFPEVNSPNGLIAKISDFGFSGMTTYTSRGVRGPLPENFPRGSGTKEWNPPECLRPPNNISHVEKNPVNQACRDIYSFGLVVCFITLNGLYPRNFVENLDEAKLTDSLVKSVQSLLSTYYKTHPNASLVDKFSHIAEKTMNLRPEERLKNLDNIRELLFDGQSYYEHPETKVFVLDFNLIPDTVHELRCSGLYDAYWASPPSFRQRAYEFLRNYQSGYNGLSMLVEPGIFKELAEKAET